MAVTTAMVLMRVLLSAAPAASDWVVPGTQVMPKTRLETRLAIARPGRSRNRRDSHTKPSNSVGLRTPVGNQAPPGLPATSVHAADRGKPLTKVRHQIVQPDQSSASTASTTASAPASADHASCRHGKPPSRRAGGRRFTIPGAATGSSLGYFRARDSGPLLSGGVSIPAALPRLLNMFPPSRTRPPDERGRSAGRRRQGGGRPPGPRRGFRHPGGRPPRQHRRGGPPRPPALTRQRGVPLPL